MSNNINYNYNDLPPFKWFVLENFPFIEADFDALTNWQLFCKLGKEINKVIEYLNSIGQQAETLTEAFNTLKNYVDNYFENLDVQEEINNKLDEMVTDGTFTNLITPLVTETLSDITNEVNSLIEDAREQQTIINNKFMDKIRYDNNNILENVTIPNDFNNSFFKKVPIYYNKDNRYFTNFKAENLKNSGGTTYYVSPTGSNSNDGLSREHPKQTINNIMDTLVSGDTLVCMAGLYPRTNFQNRNKLTKSINIICEDGSYFKFGDNQTFTVNETYSNVYQTARTGTIAVYDISMLKEQQKSVELTKVNTLQEVSLNENTWYTDNTNVYVHMNNDLLPSNDTCVVQIAQASSVFNCTDFTEDAVIYIENLFVLSGSSGCIRAINNTEHEPLIILNKCKLFNNTAYGGNLDAFSNQGCNSICIDCVAGYSKKDGFNYHDYETTPAQGIEINCKSVDNGIENDYTCQGSTNHDNSKVLRLNCLYGQSHNSNIADINNSKSLNVGLILYDAFKNGQSGNSYDYVSQGNNVSYLIGCKMKGSKSEINLRTSDSSIIYVKDTEYDTSDGNIQTLS